MIVQTPTSANIITTSCKKWMNDEVVDFGKNKLAWLGSYLPYRNGIPSDDTVSRVMGLID